MPAHLKSHLYLRAIRWIAANEPAMADGATVERLSEAPAVRLASHLWNRPALLVAEEVLEVREREG